MSVTRVLVVDDRPDVRLSFMFLLQALGYDVAEAAEGEAALAYLANNTVDVILTDLDMPGMDGIGLLRVLQMQPAPKPRIIVMTGSAIEKERSLDTARELGADAVLLKPLSKDQLQRVISQVLDGGVRR